jgi:hypothetical protein
VTSRVVEKAGYKSVYTFPRKTTNVVFRKPNMLVLTGRHLSEIVEDVETKMADVEGAVPDMEGIGKEPRTDAVEKVRPKPVVAGMKSTISISSNP